MAMARTIVTRTTSSPESALSGMCFLQAVGCPRGSPALRSAEVRVQVSGDPHAWTPRECKGDHKRYRYAGDRFVISPAGDRRGVADRCDSGGVTTLHPVRSAPPPGTDPLP